VKIVVVGVGKFGEYLAKALVNENNEVTVVDTDFDGKETLINNEDINYIEGNGLDSNVLIEAGVQNCEILISSMSGDSDNIVCSLIAKKLGAKNTIARIRLPEYKDSINYIKDSLGLSMSINPEFLTAMQIAQSLSIPNALDATSFLRGRMDVISLRIKEDNALKNLTVEQIAKKLKNKIIICAIERENEVIIPNGKTQIIVGDKIHITGKRKDINTFLTVSKLISGKTKNVMIIGGSKISVYLAKTLTDMGMHVKIIELDKKKCRELSTILDDVLIINGRASNQNFLYEEGIEKCDAIVSLTGNDEENIVYSMFASSVGVPKIITKINHINLNGIEKKANIDAVITPHKIAANQVVKYVRAMENSKSSSCDAIYKFGDDIFEIIEFSVKENFKGIDKNIKDIKFENDILICGIQRGKHIIYPTGNDKIKIHDIVLIISKIGNRKIKELNDVVK